MVPVTTPGFRTKSSTEMAWVPVAIGVVHTVHRGERFSGAMLRVFRFCAIIHYAINFVPTLKINIHYATHYVRRNGEEIVDIEKVIWWMSGDMFEIYLILKRLFCRYWRYTYDTEKVVWWITVWYPMGAMDTITRISTVLLYIKKKDKEQLPNTKNKNKIYKN